MDLNDREVVQIYFWQRKSKCYSHVIIMTQLCVSDFLEYLIRIFFSIAHHKYMRLVFIMCSIVNEMLGHSLWVCELTRFFHLFYICSWIIRSESANQEIIRNEHWDKYAHFKTDMYLHHSNIYLYKTNYISYVIWSTFYNL